MSVIEQTIVETPLDKSRVIPLANSVNINRRPEIREDILKGIFQSYQLEEEDSQPTQVMKAFSYFDQGRNTLIFVYPQRQRFQWKEHSEKLDMALKQLIANGVLPNEGSFVRLVYGLKELREKLVIQDLGFDDKHVELAKVSMLMEHSFLLHKNRRNVYITGTDDKTIYFLIDFDHEPTIFRAAKLKEDYYKFCEDAEGLEKWERKLEEIGLTDNEANDYWVNNQRWWFEQQALYQLNCLYKNLEEGNEVDFFSDEFEQLLKRLPDGNHMPPWAKKVIREIYLFIDKQGPGDKHNALTVKIYRLRFNAKLDKAWFENDIEKDDNLLWKIFESLPDNHVEGNVKISEVRIWEDSTSGGYNRKQGLVMLGDRFLELNSEEKFENLIRHEIGHAVHEKYKQKVDQWLKCYCGWQHFKVKDAEGEISRDAIDQWMALAGGWKNQTERKLTIEAIKSVLSADRWESGTFTPNEGQPWSDKAYFPRSVFDVCEKQGGEYWYERAVQWPTYNGLSFAINFYYKSLMVVKTEVLNDFILKIPEGYAAMSPDECFAELYSFYYDPGSDVSWIPEEVKDWLNNNIAPRP